MSTTTDIRHLTDAELVGILDGSDDAPGAERFVHLEECDRCADALDALRADSALVREYLELAKFEEDGPRPAEPRLVAATGRPNPWTSSWWKAAAILVLVAGPLAAFPDVRAWVVERVAGPEEEPVEVAPLDATSTILRFTPDPGAFVVDFEPGTAGTIAIVRGDGREAELRASDGAPETLVSASSIQISNRNVARYELRLPAGITGVWVRRGERAVAVSDSQIDRRAVVQLTRNGPPAEIRATDQRW
jgi:hypothetical protein